MGYRWPRWHLMVFIRLVFWILIAALLSSCQLGYIAQSAVDQAKLMRARVPLKYALEHYKLTEQQRAKLELAIELRSFMVKELKLNTKSNYSRYVHLNRDYVSYAVNASPKDQLKTYKWSFPIVGSVPYKAYFKKESAIEEAKELQEQNYDTHVRGVSAYSTLGWFEDPILSSMLRMKEHHFINTLIHETVHANLYISDHSKFNERVATFLGQLGAEAYYKKQNRQDELKQLVESESHDELLFSEFITKELKALRQWYEDQKGKDNVVSIREAKFTEMKANFKKNILPKMKTKTYYWFPEKKLNNAFLLLLELYNSDFSVLEKLANHYNRDFQAVFKELKKLEDSDSPEKDLEKMVANLKN